MPPYVSQNFFINMTLIKILFYYFLKENELNGSNGVYWFMFFIRVSFNRENYENV